MSECMRAIAVDVRTIFRSISPAVSRLFDRERTVDAFILSAHVAVATAGSKQTAQSQSVGVFT